jgi:TM2 domain-containing membrane protein YozV
MKRYAFLSVLSFILPGLGQIIKNEPGKGVGIMFFTAVGWFLLFEFYIVMHTIFLSVILFLAIITLWIWNIHDAYTKPAND